MENFENMILQLEDSLDQTNALIHNLEVEAEHLEYLGKRACDLLYADGTFKLAPLLKTKVEIVKALFDLYQIKEKNDNEKEFLDEVKDYFSKDLEFSANFKELKPKRYILATEWLYRIRDIQILFPSEAPVSFNTNAKEEPIGTAKNIRRHIDGNVSAEIIWEEGEEPEFLNNSSFGLYFSHLTHELKDGQRVISHAYLEMILLTLNYSPTFSLPLT